LTEANAEEKMSKLMKFVDEKFKRPNFIDILSVFTPLPFVLIVLILTLSIASSVLFYTPVIEWTSVLVSVVAILIAFNSYIMASRNYVNKRLAYREAERIGGLIPDRSNEISCLLPPLVSIRMENYPVKLAVLYEIDKDLFTPNKLIEKYYLNRH
jgi:hypothetical protein